MYEFIWTILALSLSCECRSMRSDVVSFISLVHMKQDDMQQIFIYLQLFQSRCHVNRLIYHSRQLQNSVRAQLSLIISILGPIQPRSITVQTLYLCKDIALALGEVISSHKLCLAVSSVSHIFGVQFMTLCYNLCVLYAMCSVRNG